MISILTFGEVDYFFFSSLLLSSLELSDAKVHEPLIRALLEAASPFCEAIVLKLLKVRHHVIVGIVSTSILLFRRSLLHICLTITRVVQLCSNIH